MPGASALSGDMQQTLSNQLSGSQGLDPQIRQQAQQDQIDKMQQDAADAKKTTDQAGKAPTVPVPTDPMGAATRTDHSNKSYQFADGGFLPSFLGSAAQTYGDQRWGKNARPRSKPAAEDDSSSGDWSWAKNNYDTSGG